MVYLYYSVTCCFMASASKRTSFTIFSCITGNGLFKACSSGSYISSCIVHQLAHRAVIAILFFIVIKLICTEWFSALQQRVLLPVELVIFYKGANAFIFQ